MLTTTDLYERHGYGIDVGDNVRFELLRGLELREFEEFKSRNVVRSQNPNPNPNPNRTVTGRITIYKTWKPGDLEIEGIMSDGYTFMLKLNQCRDLRIL
jgi:hypothetical protein